ncbi:MAG TPA: hypothetical protein PL188_07505 [Candidatus Cloacimonadota bacterium]|nr:hypothetical protein [Candidatus Cloacimonadota bacterium]
MDLFAQQESREYYEEVIDFITTTARNSFQYINIAKDAINLALFRILKANDLHGTTIEQLEAIFPKIVEEVFAKYQNISFHYCLRRTRDPELSKDIAQETIYLLLASQQEVQEVVLWVKQVSHNLLCKHYQAKKEEQSLYQELCQEASVIQQMADNNLNLKLEEHVNIIPKSVVESPVGREFIRIQSYETLADYADAEGINYEAAKTKSRRLLRDLKAMLLLALGWETSPDILDFYQYRSIQQFLRLILKPGSRFVRKKLLLQVKEVMDGVARIDDWGITMVEKERFRLYIFHRTADDTPILATFSLLLDERNHISVENCKKNQITASHIIPANVQIPKEMGRALWPYEKIISLVNEKKR